jgi:hypothetical protein
MKATWTSRNTLATGCLLWAVAGWGQAPQWDQRFGGAESDYLQALCPAADGGLLLAGYSLSAADGDKTQFSRGGRDFWVVKASAAGVRQWDRRFGGSGEDYGQAAQPTADGGYILGGTTWSGADGDKTEPSQGLSDYWVVKINASGAKQWDRRFGGSQEDSLSSIQQTADGGYILGGSSRSRMDGDKSQDTRGGWDYWIVKLDASGVRQWDRRFGGSGNDYCQSVRQTADGGYVLGGYSDSGANGDKTQATRGGRDYWIVKVDSTGTREWDQRFGGSQDDELRVVRQTTDGGYILGGYSNSGANGDKSQASRGGWDYWIVKLNASGGKQWDRRFGGPQDDFCLSLELAADGGYILSGDTDSGAGGDKTQASQGGADYWMVKIDAYGIKRWDRRFGGIGQDFGAVALPTADGGYILGGYSNSGANGDRTGDSRGLYDFWIVKIAALPPDAYEFDDRIWTARKIANGETQRRNIHEPGDRDVARFVVGRGGARHVRIETSGETGDTEIRVHRGRSGTLVGYNDDISSTNRFSRVWIRSLSRGTYFIKIIAAGHNGIVPAYDLRAAWQQIIPPDRFEPDNGLAAARYILNGQTQRRTIHRAGNRDWARFKIGSRGARDLKIETRGSAGDTEIWLYTSSGRRLAYDDDSGPGRFSRIQWDSIPPGMYHIRVQAKGNNGTLAAYTLRAQWVPQ